MSFSKLQEQYLIMNRNYKEGLYKPTLNGIDNKEMEEKIGYCQSVSGLTDMSMKHDKMLQAEARYWDRFRDITPELWPAQLAQLQHTRGTIFTERLLKCIKWLNKKPEVWATN